MRFRNSVCAIDGIILFVLGVSTWARMTSPKGGNTSHRGSSDTLKGRSFGPLLLVRNIQGKIEPGKYLARGKIYVEEVAASAKTSLT